MLFNQVVAWIGSTQSHVVHFNPKDAESEVIRIRKAHVPAQSGCQVAADALEVAAYFREIADAIQHSVEIFIVGPGSAKLYFMHYLGVHHPEVSDRVVNVDNLDYSGDEHLLAYARHYFIHADQAH